MTAAIFALAALFLAFLLVLIFDAAIQRLGDDEPGDDESWPPSGDEMGEGERS